MENCEFIILGHCRTILEFGGYLRCKFTYNFRTCDSRGVIHLISFMLTCGARLSGERERERERERTELDI